MQRSLSCWQFFFRGHGSMKTKLLGSIGLFTCMALLGVPQAQAATYNVDIVSGLESVTGTISTDKTGILASTDIIAWNLTIENNELLKYVLNNNIAAETDHIIDYVTVVGNDLTASATQLLFNYSDSTQPGSFGIFASVDTYFNLYNSDVSGNPYTPDQIVVGYGFEAFGD